MLIVGPHFIARDLLLNEAVVGLVFIERLNHIVAIAPVIWTGIVVLKARAIRVARKIQPAPGLALTVVGRREQLVDQSLVGVGTLVGRERFDLSVAGDEVTAGKPDPAPYLAACERLGVLPAATVALEDAMSGVRSAEAAGCHVVAVPWIAPIEPAPRRAIVKSLVDIDVECLLSGQIDGDG